MEIRKVHSISPSLPTMEGAGVRLHRAFGKADPLLDPFLLLDDFHSNNPDDYRAGSHGIPTGVSRPSLTCCTVTWPIKTAWATKV